ncbi:MAG: sugar phosphate isomerase/epimerase [Clostridiales bacterium]|jgi:sugar phosphate isomerase/epimerase|nr:sugar phosphate isomerase/epimerase [Clostridiales bacterium]
MKKIKLGAQLFTLRDYIQTYEDTEKTFEFLKNEGINVAQISGIGPIEPEKVAELVARFDLDICITHKPFERMQNDLDNLIEEHKMINCPSIGIGSMPSQYRGSLEGLREFIKEANEIGARMREKGIQFAYHNHAFEFERMADGRTIMDTLVEDTDSDCVHFILDTHWLQTGGVNPPDYIRKIGRRMEVCHFKDYKIVDNERKFAEIDTGNLDLDECFKACRDIGVGYIVIEQDSCDIDPRESMSISYKNLCAIAARHQ